MFKVHESVLQLGKPPSDVSGQGALTELRASLGYSGEPASLANFQIDRVSLPSIAGSPSSLETILGSAEAEKMLEILRSKILTFGEVEAKLKGSSLRKPYFDPCLRKGGTEYQQFIRRLLQSNLIDFRLSVREKAGLFVVWKKSGKQRLVVDARRSNCWFGSPCPVKLATGSSFAQIEVDHADPIELAGVDIADAFYGIELPDEFRDLFGLAPLTAEQAGISMVQGAPVARDQVVFPVFRVVPMGWTHALWICQQCHEKVVDSISTIPPALRFHDGAPIPAPRPFLHTQYVDNYIAISQEHGIAGKSAHDVAQALNQRGLPTHDVEDDIGGETLGWKFSDTAAQVTMTPRRLWKLRLGVLELLSQGWATGQLVEKLLGHLTFASLLRRELLSCFQATYVFVKKCYHVHSRLWPQVVRELKWACSLLPLVSRNMAAPWSPQVLATDASHWGRGVAKMTSTQEQVRAQARIQDRWRFTSDQERLLLSGHEADDVMHALSDVGEGQSQHDMLSLPVPELDVEFLNSEWTRVESRAWDRQEHIVTLEGRALVWAVQHLARSVNNHEKRHLLLSDSMSCVLALTKGRGGSSGMNRICRQIAALSLACDFQLHYRWCPSELNPADKPSRNRILSNYNIWDSIGDLINAEESHRSRHSWRQQSAAYYAACRNGGKEWEFWARRRAELAGWHKSQGPEADQVECQAGSARSAKASSPFKDSDPNLPGRKGHHQHSVAIIRDGLDEVSRVCRGPRLSHDLPQRGGCSSGLVDGHDVLRGRWCVGGNDYDGSHQTHENRCAEAQLAGEVLKISSCLQEVGATHGQSPTSISHVGTGSQAHCHRADRTHGWCPPDSDMELVLPTRRVSEAEVAADSRPQSGQSPLVGIAVRKFSSGRPVTALEDSRAGRSSADRPSLSLVVGGNPQAPEEREESKHAGVRFQDGSCEQRVWPSPRRMWLPSSWRAKRVPNPPWISLHRQTHPTEINGRIDEKGSLAQSEQPPTIRTRGPHQPSLRMPEPRRTESRPHGRKAASNYFGPLRWMLQAPKRCIFLELFSGSGRLSKALRRRVKHRFHVVEIDIASDASHDLSKRALQDFILLLISLDKIAGVWMGTPCTSWSRARRNDGKGPSPLRSDSQLWGLDNLSTSDQDRVRLGNNLAKFSLRVFKMCWQARIPAAIENPSSSRFWLIPKVAHLLIHDRTSMHVTDYCQDGTPWRKRTKVLTCHLDFSLVPRLCQGCRGICSRTHRAHTQLCGQVNRQFLTLIAQPYPTKLCNRIAVVFHNALMERLSRPMMKLLGF